MDVLIERLELATGPDRELSDEVLLACGWRVEEHGAGPNRYPYWVHDELEPDGLVEGDHPDVTRSIDAALTLVPEGKSWGVGSIMFDELPPRRTFAANCRREGYIGPETPAYDALGATPAIALCIAALRARAALKSPDHQSNASEIRSTEAGRQGAVALAIAAERALAEARKALERADDVIGALLQWTSNWTVPFADEDEWIGDKAGAKEVRRAIAAALTTSADTDADGKGDA